MRAYSRWLFGVAAAFNLAVAAALLFFRPWLAPALKLDPVDGTNRVLANIVGALIATFGYAYLRVAADPVRHRPYVGLAIIGKLLVVVAALWPWLMGAVGGRVPSLAAGDALFAVLFLDYLRRAPVPR
jgi:hypothetical protein